MEAGRKRARPRHADVLRRRFRTASRSTPRATHARDHREYHEGADHRSRGRARAREGRQVLRRVLANPQPFGVAISESDRARRLALVLPPARPLSQGDRRRRAARCARLSQALQPDDRRIPSRRQADRAPVPPTVDVAAMVKDYKGDAAAVAGEAFDPSPPTSTRARSASRWGMA